MCVCWHLHVFLSDVRLYRGCSGVSLCTVPENSHIHCSSLVNPFYNESTRASQSCTSTLQSYSLFCPLVPWQCFFLRLRLWFSTLFYSSFAQLLNKIPRWLSFVHERVNFNFWVHYLLNHFFKSVYSYFTYTSSKYCFINKNMCHPCLLFERVIGIVLMFFQ